MESNERKLTPGEADVAKILIESGAKKVDDPEPVKEEKPLKKARSQAELTRVRQGWTLICLAAFNLVVALLLLAYQLGIF